MLNGYIQQFFDTFADAVCITDKDGVIVLINAKHAEMTGLPRKKIIGRNAQDLVDEGVFDTVMNPRVVKGKKSATCVQRVATGKQVVLAGHPVFDERGELRYVITFIRDISVLSGLKDEIAHQKALLNAFQRLNKEQHAKEPALIVNSEAMRSLFQEINSLADTDATVLLLGETGVGKDVIAGALHNRSARGDKVFLKVDCSAIPENLVETELFGYVGGTFSGANKQGKVGLIEASASGTLFLDEIGELPLQVQSRLLRFLQDGEVMRVGATKAKRIDARIIAATNRDLQHAVKKGTFRSDLYYRLKVAVITVPPLRKRRDDIIPLARSFLDFYCLKYEKKMQLSEEALNVLHSYPWPGNVRELKNMMLSMAILGKGSTITAGALPIAGRTCGPAISIPVEFGGIDLEGKSFKKIMRELESMVIRAGMKRYGSIAETARHFQVDRSTIFRKVKDGG